MDSLPRDMELFMIDPDADYPVCIGGTIIHKNMEAVIPLCDGTTLSVSVNPVPDWQPFGTAPKDGSLILVTDGRDYAMQYWDTTPEALPDWMPWFAGEMPWHSHHRDMDIPDMKPTHWMPLPALPVT